LNLHLSDTTGESILTSTYFFNIFSLCLSLASFSSLKIARRQNEFDLTSYEAQWNVREGKGKGKGKGKEVELKSAGKRGALCETVGVV
jgi:hypothetical protein